MISIILTGSQSNKVIFSSDLTLASHAQEGKLGMAVACGKLVCLFPHFRTARVLDHTPFPWTTDSVTTRHVSVLLPCQRDAD